jgi:hypothetical protein
MATPSRPARPVRPGAVDVCVRRRRHVEVDDVRHVLDVEPARGDVRCDEQLRRAVAKASHDTIALFLRQPAVQRFSAIAAGAERLGQLVDLGARSTEDDRRRRRLHVEDARERGNLMPALHNERDFTHPRHLARRDAFARDVDEDRVAKMPICDRADRRRHGRGKERSLTSLRHSLEYCLEIFAKPMSSISSASSSTDHLHRLERQRLSTDVIERSTWSRNDDVYASLEGAELLLHGLSTVDGEDASSHRPAISVHGFRDLHGQLARRHEDQSANGAFVAGRHTEAVEHGQRERGGLARPGRGLTETSLPASNGGIPSR